MQRYAMTLAVAALLASGCAPPLARRAAARRVAVARVGRALLPVVVAEGSSERVRALAAELAAYLGKITGAPFEVKTGDMADGLAVGVACDFQHAVSLDAFDGTRIPDREHYVLRSHQRGVHIIGATELAVEHAVWDLLYRIGCRQFFPGKTWEVVPRISDLSIAVDADERPDYYARRIWYGYGLWDHNAEPYRQWCARNRAVLGFELKTGHAYDGLIRSNQSAFKEHPEFRGLLDGKRTSTKICIGNPDLRKLIVEHALRTFAANPDADSISMDPSDGGGWCECDRCKALGSISDRALTLANTVAEAVNQRFRDKYVGMYAYGQHSPPPNVRVHPNVIVSVATGFIRGGYTVDQLIAGWARQGATIGIREYYSVNVWDRDLPGRPRGSNVDYLARTIPHFRAQGARFMSAESGDNWGPCGLGYYLAARMLWDVDEARRIDALVDDFLTRAFGPAKEPMGDFYHLIDGANRPLLCDDLLGRMYRLLVQAKTLAAAPEIRARINDLALYTRYVELFRDYRDAKGAARQAAFERLIRHAYRMRGTMMIHTKALYRDLVRRDKRVAIPKGAEWNAPEDRNPWKSSTPFTEDELGRIVGDGIQRCKVADIEPVEFSLDLVPAAPLKLPRVETGTIGSHGRGVQTFYTWVARLPAAIELKVTGGLIKHYRDRGPAKVDLWWPDGDREGHGETAPDGIERKIVLKARHTGLYRITVSDGNDATRVVWPDGTPMTVVSSRARPARLHGRWSLYFYVPKGTKAVGLFADGRGTLRDGAGNAVFTFDGKRAGFHSIRVPAGQDGVLWQLRDCNGPRLLLTVPPFLARNADELLLPREVVERDSR